MKMYGFSLLELLVVVAIIAIIGVIGSGFYINYGKNVGIKSATETISFDLKYAQSKSMIGEGGFKWGVHFVNDTIDYYEIFSTPTDYSDASKVVVYKKYLPDNVFILNPVESDTKDIIFNKISGGTTLSTVELTSSNIIKTITISSVGNISIQ